MFTRRALTLTLLSLLSGPALAQATLKPETTPRLPPQAGQGLPLQDQQFLARAANLSEAAIQVGRLATEKVPSGPVKAFGAALAADHEKLLSAITGLAQKNRVSIESHASRGSWQAELERLRGLNDADFEREFLSWQLQVHLSLADMYQTQASSTPETDLARFAIITLKQVQESFDQAKQLGARHGLAIGTIKQPPQY